MYAVVIRYFFFVCSVGTLFRTISYIRSKENLLTNCMKHLSMNCFLTPLDHNNKSFERDTALILVGINNKFTILFFVFIVIKLIIYKA